MSTTVQIPCDWGDAVVSVLSAEHPCTDYADMVCPETMADLVLCIAVLGKGLADWVHSDGCTYAGIPPYHTPHSAGRWREKLDVAISDLQQLRLLLDTLDADQPPLPNPA